MNSLTTAAANLNTALGGATEALRQFTAVHDAASAEGRVVDKRCLEATLFLVQRAQTLWGQDMGLVLLADAECFLKSALGMEGE